MGQPAGQVMVQGAQQVGQTTVQGVQPVGQRVAQGAQQVGRGAQGGVAQSGAVQAQSVTSEPRQIVVPPQSKVRASIDLGSLDKVISSLNKERPRSTQAASEDGTVRIDPESEQKLRQGLQGAVEAILKLHPRFNAAFNNVQIAGNVITVEAPTAVLEADLNESRTEICEVIAQHTGVEGRLELNVVLNEVEVKLLPVKIEDRYQFIEDLNPRGVKLFIDKFDLTL